MSTVSGRWGRLVAPTVVFAAVFAVHVAWWCAFPERPAGQSQWATVTADDERWWSGYIQEQEKADQRLDQLGLFGGEGRFERFTICKPPALPEVADGCYASFALAVSRPTAHMVFVPGQLGRDRAHSAYAVA